MKKLWLWVTALCLLLTCLSVGCGGKPGEGGTLTLENGVLHWEATDADAFTGYEVDLGGGGVAVAATSYDLAAHCDYEGEFTVTVRGVTADGKRADIGSLTVNATRLAEPTVGIGGSAESGYYFEWSAVEGASGYSYDAHDGNGLRTAEPVDGGEGYRVPVTLPIRQLIRVYANGTSKDNTLLLTSNTLYQYETNERFDLALLGQYPAVFTSSGAAAEEFRVGSTLPSGYYPNMELTVYLMGKGGTAMTGNGMWGRRISYSENVWLCGNDVEGFPNSAIDLPKADQKFTIKAGLMVDRGGNVILPLYDFLDGEMMVVVDIKYQGRSVLNASGGERNPVPEVEKFDVSKADDYLYVFRSPGSWFNEHRAANALNIPVNLPDGKQTVTVSYYVCQANGDILEGNGMWGRRFSSEYVDNGTWVWLNAVELAANIPAVEIPNPTALQKFTFEAEIRDGILKMYGIDFNVGEMIIIQSVEGAETPSGNGIYVFTGKSIEEVFSVQTTLTGNRISNAELTVTFKLSDLGGGSLTGNGAWGRRLHDATGKDIWMCTTAPSDNFPNAAGTLPKAGETVTMTMKVAEINKKGIFKLSGLDFLAGEMIQITSVKYNGEEILA